MYPHDSFSTVGSLNTAEALINFDVHGLSNNFMKSLTFSPLCQQIMSVPEAQNPLAAEVGSTIANKRLRYCYDNYFGTDFVKAFSCQEPNTFMKGLNSNNDARINQYRFNFTPSRNVLAQGVDQNKLTNMPYPDSPIYPGTWMASQGTQFLTGLCDVVLQKVYGSAGTVTSASTVYSTTSIPELVEGDVAV
jgi:hypothetical protein